MHGFDFATAVLPALRRPLARMLMLSLALHVAVVMIVQPSRFPSVEDVTVISARLMEATAEQSQSEVLPPPEAEIPAPTPVPPAAPPVVPPEPLPVTAKASEPVPVVQPAPAPPAESRPPEPKPRQSEGSDLPSVPVMVDTTWYEAKQLDVQPKAAGKITPRYPPEAASRDIEGWVKLKLRVDEFGVVREVEVIEGDPPNVFDESALEAFRKGRFIPARKDGRPVRAQILIRVRYELDD